MKAQISVLLLLFLSFGVYANSNDKEAFISQALKVSEPSSGSVSSIPDSDDELEKNNDPTDSIETVEVDSSYYSVSKFNFLFYLVYKLKYSEEEDANELDSEETMD